MGLYGTADSVSAWNYTWTSGIGDALEYWGNGDGSWAEANYNPNSTGPYQMRVSGVPLPPTALLLGSGLAGLGLLRFRRREKKA